MAFRRFRPRGIGGKMAAIVLGLVAVGCAQQGFQKIVPAGAVKMVSSRDLSPDQYTSVGEMSGLSCWRNQWDRTVVSERDALVDLQRKAYAAGADGVLDAACRTSDGVDWANNCWQSVECRGVAVKFTPGGGGTPGGSAGASSGSGFVVSTAGHILTNAHVIDGCRALNGQLPSGRFALQIVNVDKRNDLAIVKADRPLSAAASFRDGRAVRAGDSVVAAGFPLQTTLANQMNVTTGTVSALAGIDNDATQLQMTAPVQPGNSGGPLLDGSGQVVGVVVAKLDALEMASQTGTIPENVNFAVKGEIARAYLESQGIAYQAGGADQAMATADIGERARSYTVFITCQ